MHLLLSSLAVASILAPSSPALTDADLATVSEAAGQLFWASPRKGSTVTLYTRPTSGGAAGTRGTVRTAGGTPSVAFDGTRYAVAYSAITGVDTSDADCGICESHLYHTQ